MSFPTWDGEKDRALFRSMSDSIGGTDGIRTVIRDDGESRVMLRTRGGNPDVTMTGKKESSSNRIVETDYGVRRYWRAKSEAGIVGSEVEMQDAAFHNDKDISRYSFLLKKFKVQSGYIRMIEPDTSVEVEPGAVGDANHWLKYRYSSDGIIGIPQLSPKKMMAGAEIIRLKEVERHPDTASMADLLLPVEGKASRTFYGYTVIRGAMFSWLYAIVKPVHSVGCTVAGRKSAIVFDEPYHIPGLAFHGVNQMPINPMDHVRVFGQPWHGIQDMAGVLTLASGNTKQGFRPGYYFDPTSVHPSFAYRNTLPSLTKFLKISCVDFGVPIPPVRDESEVEAGIDSDAEFKGYAYLNGPRRQMSPLDDSEYRKYSTLPSSSWLYKCPDGAVWCLYTSYAVGANFGTGGVPTLRIRGINMNRKASANDTSIEPLYMAPNQGIVVFEMGDIGSISDWPFDETRSDATTASKDGKKAHVNSVAYVGPLGAYSASFVLSVSLGGLDTPPTITCEYHDGRHGDLGNVVQNPNWPNGTPASEPAQMTKYLGGFMSFDGVFKKAFASIDNTYTPFDPDSLDVQPGHSNVGSYEVTYRKIVQKLLINDIELFKSTDELTQTFGLVDGNGVITSSAKSFEGTVSGLVGNFKSGFVTAALFDENGFVEIGVIPATAEGEYSGSERIFAWNMHSGKRIETGIIVGDYIGFDPKVDAFIINKWPW